MICKKKINYLNRSTEKIILEYKQRTILKQFSKTGITLKMKIKSHKFFGSPEGGKNWTSGVIPPNRSVSFEDFIK